LYIIFNIKLYKNSGHCIKILKLAALQSYKIVETRNTVIQMYWIRMNSGEKI